MVGRGLIETLAFDRTAAPSWRADGFILAGGGGLGRGTAHGTEGAGG